MTVMGNSVKMALRMMAGHKLYSAITVVGLALGLAVAILIGLFVRNELTYDRDFTDADRIYQVDMTATLPGRAPMDTVRLPAPTGPALRQAFGEVEEVTRMSEQQSAVKRGDAVFSEDLTVADPTVFRMFDWAFRSGDRATALDDPASIVLTEKTARKYFGDADPIGQTLLVDGAHEVRVTGVMRDLPSNTQFAFGALIPLTGVASQYPPEMLGMWGGMSMLTFVKLAPGADPARLTAGLPAFTAAIPPRTSSTGVIHFDTIFHFFLVPLAQAHLTPALHAQVATITPAEIATFSAVAVLVLAIACINFMNLATARASLRAREVALRKVVGASRRQVMAQFLGESLLLSVVALVLALALTEMALPSYAAFLGRDGLAFQYWRDPVVLAGLALLILVVGGVGGFYPAVVLSAYQPGPVLKAGRTGGAAGGRARALLVLLQFAVSIALMVATGVVYSQMSFAQGRALGFNKDDVVILPLPPEGVDRKGSRADTLADTLRRDPRIAVVSAAATIPGGQMEMSAGIHRTGEGADEPIVMRQDAVDYDYFAALGIPLAAGRVFDRQRPGDILAPGGGHAVRHTSVILNQTAVRRLGYTTDAAALGATLVVPSDHDEPGVQATVVGVVRDFRQGSVRTIIAPNLFILQREEFHQLIIRVKPGQMAGALALIDDTWRHLVPDQPVPRFLLDDQLRIVYGTETRAGQMFAAFSGLAIVIAALGLFGLAAFTAERRTKEIGVRKVLGAKVADIVRLLVWQFSKPVLVANVVAWPVAWFAMRHWLDGFAERVSLNPLLFVASSLSALMVAWATVGLHAARVATTRPVAALRYE
ncbi:ABC transporter permease [Azospirillum sp. B4]|uniref:ABC transporter permease n=1 Tax=Azospirillum sp. B4 TaxID=95605 RepID=UPI000346BBCB|nr:ABC transporter permease [Azospirillum sp. B4]